MLELIRYFDHTAIDKTLADIFQVPYLRLVTALIIAREK